MTAPKGTPSNVVAIGAALDAPVDAPALAQPGDIAPQGGRDEDDGLDRPRLPRDCPVRALGVSVDGKRGWFLNVQGQLVSLGSRDFGKNDINLLFTPRTHLPTRYWPRWSAPKIDKQTGEIEKPAEIVGFKQDDASEALIAACGEAGIFDSLGRVRGCGAHLGPAGALILHLGDTVMVSQTRVDGSARAPRWHEPGMLDMMVYPAAAALPRPDHKAAGPEAGARALHTLMTWRWKRGELDARLALGWIGQAFVCGAVKWRSHLFVTGGKGTGKSTLNGKDGLLDRLLGGGVMRTGNATEAAVRQKLRSQTIPVVFDEFEATEFNAAKTKAVIELARVSSSGDDMHKGGQDHQVHEFVLRSAFQFSAILMPSMQPQDRSRFAILELRPFAVGGADAEAEADDLAAWFGPAAGSDPDLGPAPAARGIDLDALGLPALGRQLQRRMVDGWARWPETLRRYQAALDQAGHTQRGCDQFGTLLACADLLLEDALPDAALVEQWARACAPERMAEIRDTDEEHDLCLTHLATSAVQARGGDDRTTVAAWIRAAMDINPVLDFAGKSTVSEEDKRKGERLEHIGLRLVAPTRTPKGEAGARAWRGPADGVPWLAVAGDHLQMAEMFAGTRWHSGGWSQALGRIEIGGSAAINGAAAIGGVKIKYDGRSIRSTLVPIAALFADDPHGDAA